MKNFSIIFFLAVLSSGCKREINPDDISKLNGYWEIEKVILPDGKTKDYKINETIDYIKADGNSGFRKKVMPQVNGKYLENGHAEKIEVIFTNGNAFLYYTTGYAHWKEQIMELSGKTLVLKNDNNLEYHYKKPIPFSVK